MFIWTGHEIINQIKNLKNIRKITIATAFMSWYGLDILRKIIITNNLKPEHVLLYLSTEFSNNNPAELLSELIKISKTHIVKSPKLHAKAFLFEGEHNLFLTGSSNFTRGGFLDNLELNTMTEKTDIERLRIFFDHCNKLSVPVNEEIIKIYKETDAERQEIKKTQSSFRGRLQIRLLKDAFAEDKYPNIENQFFIYRDYETLFMKNQERIDPDIDRRRKDIQRKMLRIDACVNKAMGNLGLAHHWRAENITSTIVPGNFNRHRVAWCGVRYTRKKTAKYIRELKLSGDGHGFPKYACLQFCLTSDGFEINLFHAVRHEAVDRNYLKDKLYDKAFCAKVSNELSLLTGHSFYWHAGDENFSIDDEDPEDFLVWYKANDRDGVESYLAKHFTPNSPELRNEDTISEVFIKYAKILLPLFKLLSFSWGE